METVIRKQVLAELDHLIASIVEEVEKDMSEELREELHNVLGLKTVASDSDRGEGYMKGASDQFLADREALRSKLDEILNPKP